MPFVQAPFGAYHVECSGEYVLLHGLETENEVLLFKACISFSREQEMQVRIFARNLAESETVPRMMIELAEEYFSSASFDRFKV